MKVELQQVEFFVINLNAAARQVIELDGVAIVELFPCRRTGSRERILIRLMVV